MGNFNIVFFIVNNGWGEMSAYDLSFVGENGRAKKGGENG